MILSSSLSWKSASPSWSISIVSKYPSSSSSSANSRLPRLRETNLLVPQSLFTISVYPSPSTSYATISDKGSLVCRIGFTVQRPLPSLKMTAKIWRSLSFLAVQSISKRPSRSKSAHKLNLGPIFFNWSPKSKRPSALTRPSFISTL